MMGYDRFIRRHTRFWGIVAGFAVGTLILSLFFRKAFLMDDEATLWAFSLVHFAGYLFFIVSPVEIVFARMVAEDFAWTELAGIAIGTAITAQLVDYAIGYAASNTVIHRIIGDRKYSKASIHIDRYGGLTLFLFNLLPLSSPIIILVAGMIRYPLRWVLTMSLAGLTVKYLLLIWFLA